MANRYCNLVGTNKIKDEWYKINEGFDKVQQEMDEHVGSGGNAHALATSDEAGFMSSEDKDKLDNIEEGAEVNQNAFAKVNELEADNPSDELTIEGGTGITVTTNPNNKKITITATGTSTPGKHGSSHTEFGSDPIPFASETEGGLMSAEDKQKLAELEGLPDEVSELKEKISKPQLPASMINKIKKKNDFKVEFPDGFSWTDAPITIYKNLNNEIYTEFDAADFQYVGAGKTYYVAINGNDSNDGLTPSTALRSVHVARAKPDVDIIIVAEGYYEDMYAFNNLPTQNKNITIKAAPGANVILSTRRRLSWSKTEGYTNVYNASRTQVATVWDSKVLDEFGDFTKLQEVESIEEVDATPGSYYYNSPDLYIHTVDSRAADNNIHVFLDLHNLYNRGDYVTYIEGIKLYGGNTGAAYVATTESGQNPLFVAKNCEFKYANGGNGGLTALGADVILQNCIFSRNARDGANYHARNGRVNRVIEVDCVGRNNGLGRNTDTDNNSTMHDGGKIIRVNCTYHGSEGPNVHDIDTGTESWNIGCVSYASAATLSSRNSNYMVENGAKMWLDTCIGYDSINAFRVSNGELYIRNVLFDDGNQLVDGTLVEY